MLEHGGRLRQAAAHYGIAVEDWLDLSTGLAPYVWPLPALGPAIWARLPEEGDGLETIAAGYYGAAQALPVAGSQAAIQTLPQLFASARVGFIEPCYAEHRYAWERAGHETIGLDQVGVASHLERLDVLVVVNPNNPTGTQIDVETLLEWHEQLHRRGGCLIVDEAFADIAPEHSLAEFSDRPGLIVLRSLGKFFGLAGVRLGFVLSEAGMLVALQRQLGPWSVSGPARAVGKAVLADHTTQTLWRARLRRDGQRLVELLTEHGLSPAGGCALFQWVPHPQAADIHAALARQGILLRLFDQPAALRIGLPGSESAWQRLHAALADMHFSTPARAGV
ncbi:threonine-phosphate decarboxylase CobD [Halopseudomonas pelagia]|uniref:threonine-phosphate decarboxylase n=1 Tax=Halopseudomonas pelagia TaxID=553151 RepID=A0AA92ELR5_9GAMM|nr:threonine-phosphate decarboxylase CobD [Halopseudomonas pelagia]PCD01261.1 threonine-phosphate decarboxylase [Halopseudomonas pelagia]QFY57551.1 threonine-phosphate decarboxylase [Halopseudomonas pelagia]